jgi:hypothetical protein
MHIPITSRRITPERGAARAAALCTLATAEGAIAAVRTRATAAEETAGAVLIPVVAAGATVAEVVVRTAVVAIVAAAITTTGRTIER